MKTQLTSHIPAQARPDQRSTVVIVDGNDDLRELMHLQLARRPRLHVVDEASSGEDAVWCCADLQPDIVILDIEMPGMDGLQTLQLIKDVCPNTKVLIYSTLSRLWTQDAAHDHGADGYVVKSGGRGPLLMALDELVTLPTQRQDHAD